MSIDVKIGVIKAFKWVCYIIISNLTMLGFADFMQVSIFH